MCYLPESINGDSVRYYDPIGLPKFTLLHSKRFRCFSRTCMKLQRSIIARAFFLKESNLNNKPQPQKIERKENMKEGKRGYKNEMGTSEHGNSPSKLRVGILSIVFRWLSATLPHLHFLAKMRLLTLKCPRRGVGRYPTFRFFFVISPERN